MDVETGLRLSIASAIFVLVFGSEGINSAFCQVEPPASPAALSIPASARTQLPSTPQTQAPAAPGEPPQQAGPESAPRSQSESFATPTKKTISAEERGDIYLARKEYVDAVDYFRRALRDKSYSDASLWNKLGIAYQLEMNYTAARKAYKESSRRNSDFAEPWNNLGTTYFLQNKFGKSLKYYRHAIKLRPDSPSFHMNLGTSYSRLKKFNEAIEEYRTALRLDPNVLTEHSSSATTVQPRGNDVEFYYYVAKVFASMSRPDEAVRYLRRALEDGFKDMKRLDQDPDFQKISKYPAYVELRNNPPVPIED